MNTIDVNERLKRKESRHRRTRLTKGDGDEQQKGRAMREDMLYYATLMCFEDEYSLMGVANYLGSFRQGHTIKMSMHG